MPWGKHKGTPLRELPLHYLRFITKWLRTQPWAKSALKEALWAEYGRRVLADETLFARMVKRPPPELEELVFEEYDRRYQR